MIVVYQACQVKKINKHKDKFICNEIHYLGAPGTGYTGEKGQKGEPVRHKNDFQKLILFSNNKSRDHHHIFPLILKKFVVTTQVSQLHFLVHKVKR